MGVYAWEGPLEKGKATHPSILAWRIPWTTGSQRVGHDRATFMLGVSFGTWTLSCNMKTLVPRARDQTPTPSPVSTHSF